MQCKRCGGIDISIARTSVVKNRRGIGGWVYWLCGIWLIDIFIWVFAFVPRLILAIIRPRKVKTTIHTEAVCQNCGNVWRV